MEYVGKWMGVERKRRGLVKDSFVFRPNLLVPLEVELPPPLRYPVTSYLPLYFDKEKFTVSLVGNRTLDTLFTYYSIFISCRQLFSSHF